MLQAVYLDLRLGEQRCSYDKCHDLIAQHFLEALSRLSLKYLYQRELLFELGNSLVSDFKPIPLRATVTDSLLVLPNFMLLFTLH